MPASKKKVKPTSIRLLKKKLWTECRRLTRERYGNICYTCGKLNLSSHDWQTGHGKPMGALPLRFKYDLRNLRPQCKDCNVWKGGCSDIFIAKLEQEKEGLQFLVEACYLDKEANAWRIRQDVPLLGAIESREFITRLLAEYRSVSYNSNYEQDDIFDRMMMS